MQRETVHTHNRKFLCVLLLQKISKLFFETGRVERILNDSFGKLGSLILNIKMWVYEQEDSVILRPYFIEIQILIFMG